MFWINSEKGSALTTVLGLVGVTGIIYAYTEKSVNNGIHEQKIILAGVNHNDLEKKVGTLCSSLFSVKQGAAKSGKYLSQNVLNCTNKSGNCKAINNPNKDNPNTHSGYPIHLFNSAETTRHVGSQSCPAFYTAYGAPTSTDSDMGRCAPKKLDAFAVFGSVAPTCGGNTANCQSATALKVKCVVKRLESNYGRSKDIDDKTKRAEAYSVNNYDITGFMCPNTSSYDPTSKSNVQKAIIGVDGNGQFKCAPMLSVRGPTGPKGPNGVGITGPQGPSGGVYEVARSGGCFAKDTLILTDRGEVPVQKLSGDELIWNPMTKNYHQMKYIVSGPEKYPMIKLTFQDYDITVTRFHPMTTSNGSKQAYKIKPGEFLLTIKGLKKVKEIKTIKTSDPINVYNFEIWGNDTSLTEHQVVANGVVTGDLHIQKELKDENKFDQLDHELFSHLNYDMEN